VVATVVSIWWTQLMARTEVESPVTGTVWKIIAAVGDTIAAGDPVMVLESMKMEIPVDAPVGGTVTEMCVAEGDRVIEDDPVAVIESD